MLKRLTVTRSTSERPRLLLVAASPPPFHGTNMANLALIESGLAQEFETTLLDISDHRDTSNLGRMDFDNVRLALTHLVQLGWFAFTRRPRVVYILLSQNNLAFLRDGLFILAARLLGGARVVAHLHGGNFRSYHRSTNRFMRAFIDLCLRQVKLGVVLGDCLRGQLDPWVRDTVVVSNGTDCLLDEAPAKDPSVERIPVLWLGSLYRSKGIIDLAEAIALVQGQPGAEGLHFEIAGEFGGNAASGMGAAETRAAVMAHLEGAHAQERVTFHGLVTGEKKLALLRRSAIFVLPSWNEGQPVSILEAMAAGTPCIATPVGAVAETIVHEETGLLVARQSPGELAEALLRLARDPGLRARLGEAARRRYETHYTKAAFVDRMTRVFRQAVS